MNGFGGLGRLAQVAVTVGDVAAAVAYYRDSLGMRLLFESGGMAFFDCDGTRLLVGPAEESTEARPGGAGTFLYFAVADIRAAYESLRARDVEFEEAPRKIAELAETEVWLAFLRDPWGNKHGLMSEVPIE